MMTVEGPSRYEEEKIGEKKSYHFESYLCSSSKVQTLKTKKQACQDMIR